jgi:hypothetical protein
MAGEVQWRGAPRPEVPIVLDAVFVIATVAFFALSLGYAAGCDRIIGS